MHVAKRGKTISTLRNILSTCRNVLSALETPLATSNSTILHAERFHSDAEILFLHAETVFLDAETRRSQHTDVRSFIADTDSRQYGAGSIPANIGGDRPRTCSSLNNLDADVAAYGSEPVDVNSNLETTRPKSSLAHSA